MASTSVRSTLLMAGLLAAEVGRVQAPAPGGF